MIDQAHPLSTAALAADLPDAQRLALAALLSGLPRTEAAREAGVTDRTLHRWLQDPAFLTALRHARSQHWTEVTTRLQQASMQAVDTLLEVMAQEDHPLARVRAARAVLELAARALDLDALHARASQLEADLEAYLQHSGLTELPPPPPPAPVSEDPSKSGPPQQAAQPCGAAAHGGDGAPSPCHRRHRPACEAQSPDHQGGITRTPCPSQRAGEPSPDQSSRLQPGSYE